MDKFFYFRTADTAADDDSRLDSCFINVSKITGIQALTNTTITIYFESKYNDLGIIAFGEQYLYNSTIDINIVDGSRKVVMEAIAEASNLSPHDDGVVVIADDVTKTYISRYITSVGAISELSSQTPDTDNA
jgi:hypothetical protein